MIPASVLTVPYAEMLPTDVYPMLRGSTVTTRVMFMRIRSPLTGSQTVFLRSVFTVLQRAINNILQIKRGFFVCLIDIKSKIGSVLIIGSKGGAYQVVSIQNNLC